MLRAVAGSLLLAIGLISVPPTNAFEVLLSEVEFFKEVPSAVTQTFDGLPTGTLVEDTNTGSDDPCRALFVIDDVHFLFEDFEQNVSCWWSANTSLSDGPLPVSPPHFLTSSGIGGFPQLPGRETISFGPGRAVQAFGFYLHSAVSATFINQSPNEFDGWRIIVTEVDGKVTTTQTDGYLGAGPVPPYFGFLSETGIVSIRIESGNRPGDTAAGSAYNWSYDNVSRSEIRRVVGTRIFPWDRVSRINICSGGDVDVAILTDELLDASSVDANSVRLGPSEAQPEDFRFADVDHDGDADLILEYRKDDTGIQVTDTQVEVTGATYQGEPIVGLERIDIYCKGRD